MSGGETMVTIQLSTAFLLIIGAVNLFVLGPVAWIVKGAISDIRRLNQEIGKVKEETTKDIGALRDLVQREYVHGNLYHRDIQEIKTMLSGIYEKLDQKADKQ